ncbi:MarR family winged helix-turn-helix transcriptional regulator [Tropicimonas marinistellae]|uniref:MarR family winged helix-turn-helix transcriptional regulator n=1 Tax=Tropicimonas marinistellae TaxID=1739787 RepID=UPI00082CC9B5|nr:MarR family transcriptional regulator [Tropicimonas marinistellae]
MELEAMAGHLIRRLHQHSAHVFQLHARESGVDLTPVQYAAMDTINRSPGIAQAGMAARIAYDRATVGGVIERLIDKGYVARAVSRRDRRARELTLTAEGRRVLCAFRPAVEALQLEILPGLTNDERSEFLALARKALVATASDGADT